MLDQGKPEEARKILVNLDSAVGVMVARLSVGVNLPGIPTSEREAVEMTDEFIRKMAVQQGKAQVEVEDAVQSNVWIETAKENLWGVLLTALGVSGLGTAGVAKMVQVYMNTKRAVKDAVDTGEELATAVTPEEVKAVKKKNAERQKRNGTKDIIEKALNA